jgi:hypothetical protein
MPGSRFLIESQVLTTSAASITFSSIPATYTDLVVRISARSSNSGSIEENIILTYNNSTGSYSRTSLKGEVAGFPSSFRASNATNLAFAGNVSGSTATSNTFSNSEIYIPSYTVAQNKPSSHFSVSESNAVNGPVVLATAGLRSNTAAITSIEFTMSGGSSYASGSSFYLYGISNA